MRLEKHENLSRVPCCLMAKPCRPAKVGKLSCACWMGHRLLSTTQNFWYLLTYWRKWPHPAKNLRSVWKPSTASWLPSKKARVIFWMVSRLLRQVMIRVEKVAASSCWIVLVIKMKQVMSRHRQGLQTLRKIHFQALIQIRIQLTQNPLP